MVTFVDRRTVVPISGDPDADVGSASILTTGELVVRVSVRAQFREFGVCVLPPHRMTPVSARADWRREVLDHAAIGANGHAAEIASYAPDQGHHVRLDRLTRSLGMLAQRVDCADFEALGLLDLWHRVPECPTEVRSALVGLKYWINQPGLELLAGQTFAHAVFTNTE